MCDSPEHAGGGEAALSFDAIGALLDASHRLHPDSIAAAVASVAEAVGADSIDVYVVDYDQRYLAALDGGDRLDVEGTIAGRAFQLQQTLTDTRDGQTRIWTPLLDGADRVGVLGANAVTASDALLATLRWLATVAAGLVLSKQQYGDGIEHARRTRDMDLAAELRWAMLPPLTATAPRVAIAGILEPAYEIAGDCFDYALNGDTAHLAILDAVGHGLEASRIANLAVTAYRHARRRGRDLRETFGAVDRVIAEEFGAEKFVTGQLSELALATGQLRILNAGHPHPLLLRSGTRLAPIECTPAPPLGFGSEHLAPVDELTVDLEPGDRLLFFTDGVIEARSATGEEFGRTRLGDLLVKAAAAQLPVAETVRRLCHAVVAHEAARLRDDATLLLVEWAGREADPS